MRLAMGPRGRSICAMLGLLSLAACVVTIVDMDERLAKEADVIRDLIDLSVAPHKQGALVGDSGAVVANVVVIVQDRYVPPNEKELAEADRWFRDSVPDAPQDLLADFRGVARDTSRIVAFPLHRGTLRLVADSTIERIFDVGIPADTMGWARYRLAYPNSRGFFSFSRVGLSTDGTWAMLMAGHQSGSLAGGGGLLVMVRRGETWHVRAQRPLWVI